MTDQTNAAVVATATHMQVDPKKLPAKTPIKKVSTKRKGEKAARVAYKDFKKRVRKVLTNTFHVSSMLEFALKFNSLKEHNIEGIIQGCYTDCIASIMNRTNLTPAVKTEAVKLFSQRVIKAREFNPSPETAADLILGRKSKTENVLSSKEKKKIKKTDKQYKSDPLKSVHLAVEDLHAIGAVTDEAKADFDKSCLKKPKKAKKAPKKDKPKKIDHSFRAGINPA
jgi:hypothetical protein